jgi:hypothetical protein
MSRHTPWAVLLCKFKDDKLGFVTTKRQEVEALFTAGDIENVVTFWRDVSYGELDLSGSTVLPESGWLTLEQNQKDFEDAKASLGNTGARQAMVGWARKAASNAKIVLDGYYGLAVFMSTHTDLWGGLQDGSGIVVCDVDSDLAQIVQEYGHGYGLKHSRAVTNPTDYNDPFCIMSGLPFGGTDPTFTGRFGRSGPLMCSPYVEAAGWFSPSQMLHLATNGSYPSPITLRLSALGSTNPLDPRVAMFGLSVPYEATYFIEYRSAGWDRGMGQSQVVIHQRRPDEYAYYAGSIAASTGTKNGVKLLPARSWIDSEFDLSVRLNALLDEASAVEISVGPAAAARPLSVRTIARTKLNLEGRISVDAQILQPATRSVRTSLIDLLVR